MLAIDVTGVALRVTALEAAIALAIVGAVLATVQRARAQRRSELTKIEGAVLGLASVAILAAVAAPDAARVAWLGAARLTGTSLLTLAFAMSARDALARSGSTKALADTLFAGALATAAAIVIALGIVEQAGGDGLLGATGAALDETLLQAFRPKASVTDAGARRLTASFGHANLAASWLAMATPLLVAAAIERRRWRWMLVILAVMVTTLAETLSRSGLAAGVVGVLVLIAFLALVMPRRSVDFVRSRPSWLPAGLAAAAITALALLLARSPTFGERWGLRPRPLIAADYTLTSERTPQGDTRVVMSATNRGVLCWRAWGRDRHEFELRPQAGVGTSAEAGSAATGLRKPLTQRVCADETATAIWTLPTPAQGLAGAQAELVHNGMRRFSELGVPAARLEPSVGTTADAPTRATDAVVGLVPLGREALWRAAVALWQQRPLLGHGPDTFRVRKASVVERSDLDDREHANNLALEVLADMGLLGLLALLGIALTIALATFHAWRRADVGAVAASAACLAFAVHGLADSPLYSWGPMVLLALAIGTLSARSTQP